MKNRKVESLPLTGTDLGDIYELNYIKGNIQQFKLIRFDKDLELEDIIKYAKRYCARNNLRFVFIGPAVTTIPIDEGEGEIIQ